MGVIVVGMGRSLDSSAMAGCCTPSGYRKVFGERAARRDVRKYRRRGLDRAARRIADFLVGGGVAGDSVLEVGGGVGAIQLELLKAGAARTTNVELSPEYEPYAAELLGEDARVERRVGDFVRDADADVADRGIRARPPRRGRRGARSGVALRERRADLRKGRGVLMAGRLE